MQAPALIPTPPSPPEGLIGGHLLKFSDPVPFYMQNMQEYGDIVQLNANGLTMFQINNPDMIQEVLVHKASSFQKSPIYKRLLSMYLGNGLLISDGEFWKRQRKLAQPAFHMKRITTYADTMTSYSQQMLDEWQDGEQRNINEEMMRLTLWIVGKTLFDADLSTSSGQVAEALEFLLADIPKTAKQIIRLPDWVPTPVRNRRKHVIDTLERVVNPIIEERRRTGEDHGDLLSMLLLARDEDGNGMTDRQLRDEAITLVLAGHETTANALTWTFYLLS
ncbi:MAG: cytochrome P450, partial [Anaerolineae bacterium]|nr:cytochrome P450 [Anaerolineae bacterium]